MTRPDARGVLLDTAERLFAEQGIAVVSDRRIAEEAGNTNHSAVRYYFGGREGLLTALLERHLSGLEARRRELFEPSDSLLGDLRALVVPSMEAFAALPTPSWRARFLSQALLDPTAADILRASSDRAPVATEIFYSIGARLDHLDPQIVTARASLMTHLVHTACAQIEQQGERTGEPPAWLDAADFLCDAIGGMLQAPITQRAGQP